MKEIKIGVCKGRHPLPVDYYVFPEEVNPLEVRKLEDEASMFLGVLAADWKNVDVITTTVMLPNQVDYHDISVNVYDAKLVIYATGLTVAVLAVVKAAKELFKEVVVMHYNRDSNSYYPQEI